MKKMTENAQMNANGGKYKAYCKKCKWGNTVPDAFLLALRMQVASHNQIYPGHNAKITHI